MATSVTVAQLRGLARLYRRRVDGAAQMLTSIIEHSAHELPTVLGFPMKNLERLRDHDDPVEVLVATIEGAPRVARELRERISHESATAMAMRLAETARRRGNGHYALDSELLGEVLARYPGRVATFGTRGSCGSLRLRAILRELRGVRATSVIVTNDQIVVSYEGERCRGLIRLALHEPIVDDTTLIVPIDMRLPDMPTNLVDAPEHEESSQPHEPPEPAEDIDRAPEGVHRVQYKAPSRHEDAPGGVLPPPGASTPPGTFLGQRRGSAVRRPEPVRRMAVRMLEALVAAALGGGP